MTWHIPFVILIIAQPLLLIFIKIASNKIKEKAVGIFFPLLFCLFLSSVYAFLTGMVEISPWLLLIAFMGVIDVFGNCLMWKAFELSLSKSALLVPLMEVITITLAVIFLREGTLWNIQLIGGAGLCFLAIHLLNLPVKEKEAGKEMLSKKWFFYMLTAVLIFGVGGFFLKLFSFNVSRQTFLLGWYSGSLLSCLTLLTFKGISPFRVPAKTIILTVPVAIALMITFISIYWTYQLGAPVSVAVPIRGLSITVIPMLAGWFIFREREAFKKREWFGFLLGVIGVILILFR